MYAGDEMDHIFQFCSVLLGVKDKGVGVPGSMIHFGCFIFGKGFLFYFNTHGKGSVDL